MKKTSPELKRYLIKYAYRKNRHELSRKRKREIRRRVRFYASVKNNRNKKFLAGNNSSPHSTCVAPPVFSLFKDPIAVINYFKEARKSFMKSVPVFFDLSLITEMGPETLTFFCALISNKSFTSGTAYRGNVPQNKSLKDMFRRAGFYSFVRPYGMFEDDHYDTDVYGKLIHRVTRKMVEPKLAKNICDSAMEHTFGSTFGLKHKIYPVLIECMANTRNHANYGLTSKEFNWWMLAYKEPDTNVTKFCFLDLGVGIFGSLDEKFNRSDLPSKIKGWFSPGHNRKTLVQIFGGAKKTSTTGLAGRGEGLNFIYDSVTSNPSIHNFMLLSNDVSAKLGYNLTTSIKTINGNFDGTLYYWELVPKP